LKHHDNLRDISDKFSVFEAQYYDSGEMAFDAMDGSAERTWKYSPRAMKQNYNGEFPPVSNLTNSGLLSLNAFNNCGR